MTTTSLARWIGSLEPDDQTGSATFQAGNRSVSVYLMSFAEAMELASLIDFARSEGQRTAHTALVQMLQGALNNAGPGPAPQSVKN